MSKERMKASALILVALVASSVLFARTDVEAAQDPAVPAFILKQVGPKMWAAIDTPAAKGLASSNSGFVIGDDGVAVIDSFTSEDAARQLLVEIRRHTALPIKFVINTHHHPDHVAGN